MTELSNLTQQAALDAVVFLFRFDATSIGGGIEHFCKGTLGGEPVSFGSVEYRPIDIEMSDFQVNAGGVLPTPKLRVANTDGYIQGLVNAYGDLIGCELRRVRTFRRFLDGQPNEDPTAYLGPDVFRVERKSDDNFEFFEWELSAAIDQEGKMIPGGVVLRDTCPLRYRFYQPFNADAAPDGFVYPAINPCPYTGTSYFDVVGNVTTPSGDRCGRQLSGCKLRFGEDQPLPFGGFPGVSRVRQ